MNTSKLTLSIVTFIISTLPAHATQTCLLNGKNVNLNDGSATKGKSGMIVCTDDDSGKILRKQELRDGMQVGKAMMVDYEGNRKEYAVNAKGNIEGHVKVFDKLGALVRESDYENGSVVGLEKLYWPSGRLRQLHQGRMSLSWNKDGELSSIQCDKKSYLDEDKKLCGWKGKSIIKLGRTQKTFQEGNMIEQKESYPDGKIQSESQFVDHELIAKKIFYMNGKPQRVSLFEKKDKVWIEFRKEYFDTGVVSLEGHYIYDRPIGEERQFFEDGKLSLVKNFNQNSELDGEQISYDLKQRPDLKQYYSNGVLKREITYKDGELKSDYEYYPDGSRKLK